MNPWDWLVNNDVDIAHVGNTILDSSIPKIGDCVRVINPMHHLYSEMGHVQGAASCTTLSVRFLKDQCEIVEVKCADVVDGGLQSLKKHFPDTYNAILEREG